MDKFKSKLKLRLGLLGWCAGVYIGVNILLYARLGVKGSENASDFIQGFQFGIGFFIVAVLLYFIIQYISALNSVDRLKKLYITENDERRKTVKQKSGSFGMKTAAFSLSGASVLAGYLDVTVFFTLLCSSLFVALIHATLKLYYRSKY